MTRGRTFEPDGFTAFNKSDYKFMLNVYVIFLIYILYIIMMYDIGTYYYTIIITI